MDAKWSGTICARAATETVIAVPINTELKTLLALIADRGDRGPVVGMDAE